jgi:mannosyltransferase OCH1-like enzyme
MFLTQYWDRKDVPAEIAVLFESHRSGNPGLQHRVFDRDAAAAHIAAHNGPRAAAAFAECAVPAMQADYFRYCALLVDGGFWSDADARCVQPLSGLLPDDADGVLFERPNNNVPNGCMAFRAPGHPLMQLVHDIATAGIERRVSNSVWVTTGPGILTYLMLLSRLGAEDRRRLDYDHIGVDVTRSIRLCAEIAAASFPDLDRLFDGVAVRPFALVESHAPDAPVEYKAGPAHWVHWPGSIFSSGEVADGNPDAQAEDARNP